MQNQVLTKEAIRRLTGSPVKVALFNGCFKIASVEAKLSRHSYELTVEVTHPLLEWQCGNRNAVKLTKWSGSIGKGVDVPEELNGLVDRLRTAARMSDDEAAKISRENTVSFDRVMCALGRAR